MSLPYGSDKIDVLRCKVCAQPAKATKCVKCKTPYCSVACQTVDWKERDHKKECKRLVKASAVAAKGASDAPRDEATTPPLSPKPKAAPPVVDGPARGRADVARARAAAAAATAAAPAAPEPEHWMGSPRCPVCLEDWDVNLVPEIRLCCCRYICHRCEETMGFVACPLCRTPYPEGDEESLAMLRQNVENDNPMAISEYGRCYATGELGLMKSQKKAARLFQRGADLGAVIAILNLGFAYEHGHGVKLDKKKMIKYYRMAANRGLASAQYNLGSCFYGGNGVAQDHKEAFRFHKLAADQGLTVSETCLGLIYENGKGVACNTTEAARWYERAAAKGHQDAIDDLARIDRIRSSL